MTNLFRTTFGKLHEALLQQHPKRKHEASIMEMCSVVTAHLRHGCMEADREDRWFLANWNAKNFARITGRTIPEEQRHPTETCDLVKSVRKWRMK